ncbi:MAG TPA: hypothetical protein VES40_03655, partial [Ilumatobacteraceae bacterium]|nr:hypothetical protein [Ilumatobacteraceae bacterium]
RRRTFIIFGVAAAVTAGAAYGGHRLTTGGQVTQVGVAEALDRYREQASESSPPPTPTPTASAAVAAVTTSTAPPVGTLVTPGVYQYATLGFDRVDVLTGARHDYPEVTTMTVVPFGCGVQLRWDVAVERWDSWDWCVEGNAIRTTGWVGYHEFFDTAGRNDYTCDGDARPLDAPAGTTWNMTCRVGDRTQSSFAGTVIGRTSLPVAGTDISVLHIRYDVDVTGESTGQQRIEGWYRITDGLPVREHLTTSTTQQTVIGATNFDEEYTIDLLTPTPNS